jgi:hypothetical protein
MPKRVETAADNRGFRRWCVALLQDVGEMERKLNASKPATAPDDETGSG